MEDKETETQQAETKVEFAEITKLLEDAKKAIVKIGMQYEGLASVIAPGNQAVMKIDEAYFWACFVMQSAVRQYSPENMEAAAEQALARGNFKVVQGDPDNGTQ